MIYVLEDSEDEPPTPKSNTNRMGAPPDLADYESNNKQQIAESMEVKMAHAAGKFSVVRIVLLYVLSRLADRRY